MDVALVTCRELPEPDRDAAPLLEALAAAGLDAALLAWDDPEVDWRRPRLALLRSTWNYPWHAEAFAAWAERTADLTTLLNPWPLVRWNLHKGYLLELAARGVPTVPTALIARGQGCDLGALCAARGWSQIVIKPAVSAGSYLTRRFARETLAEGQAFVTAQTAARDLLVQPYLAAVDGHGERALVHIEGELTHAVRKTARFADDAEQIAAVPSIDPAERALAARVLAQLDAMPLYARVDLAPGPDGAPLLMELELIEPSLFFAQGPRALARLVAALGGRLAQL